MATPLISRLRREAGKDSMVQLTFPKSHPRTWTQGLIYLAVPPDVCTTPRSAHVETKPQRQRLRKALKLSTTHVVQWVECLITTQETTG